jgi:hypothetical protein
MTQGTAVVTLGFLCPVGIARGGFGHFEQLVRLMTWETINIRLYNARC